MDAPNAPNPANPNAQDQFVDAIQGPTNWGQGTTVQNQAQVTTNQNQAQAPAGQIPTQGPAVQIPVQGPIASWSKYTSSATTTTSSSTTSPCRYCIVCFPDNLSKFG